MQTVAASGTIPGQRTLGGFARQGKPETRLGPSYLQEISIRYKPNPKPLEKWAKGKLKK
jgi:hypothetical protein